MEQITTYTVKSKEKGLIFLFKYDLNGNLKAFEIVEGELNGRQMKWLFAGANFPADESTMRNVWQKEKSYTANFEIIKATPVLDFENLWQIYNNKVKKFEAEKSYNKLKEPDKIRCFLAIKGYDKYLAKSGVAKAHLSTFINQRYFEDEWSKA
jgi:hypothetical protein